MQNVKERAALSSIAASAGLTVAKAVVGTATGSLAILSEAGHSLLDLAATVMTYFAVRVSAKPADEEHHYGHGKVESVSALAETALLFVLSGVVIWEAVQRLLGSHGPTVEATLWAFGVMAASVIIDFFRARVDQRLRDVPAMVLGDVHVEHRLVDPLVAHPRLQPPRVHAEQRGVRPEGVT